MSLKRVFPSRLNNSLQNNKQNAHAAAGWLVDRPTAASRIRRIVNLISLSFHSSAAFLDAKINFDR
jgi:hypothetical protein